MNFNSLGERLRVARKALGQSQDQMAAACGVSREMWGKYERSLAVPGGEVLAKVAEAGADVVYVLTGVEAETRKNREDYERGTALARATLRQEIAQSRLPPRQRALLNNYEHADDSGKKIIEGTAAMAAGQATPTSARPGRKTQTQTINATVGGDVVGGSITMSGNTIKNKS